MKKLAISLVAVGIAFGIVATGVSAEEYEVKQGDTLGTVADQYQTTVDELVNINDLNDTTIYPKQILSVSEKSEKNDDSAYIVQEGDTLSEIADEFDVSVTDIQKWNDLPSDLIVAGQEMELNGSNNDQDIASESKRTYETPTMKKEEEKTAEIQETNSEASAENSNENTNESDPISEEKPTQNHQNKEQDNEKSQSESPNGETVSASATAYSASCNGCSGVTSTGVDLNEDPGKKVIAVDPDVIPLGSEVYVEGYGYATAEDTGGDIEGNRIDLHVPSEEEALEWGSQNVDVTIVE